MVELSIKTVAIVILFVVIAALAIIFIFNVYSASTGESESFSDMSENIIEEELKASMARNFFKSNLNINTIS